MLHDRLLETGIAFERDLVAYRRTLKAVIGRTHPDYQKLRVDHARTPDHEDDEPEAAQPQDTHRPGATSLKPTPEPTANAHIS